MPPNSPDPVPLRAATLNVLAHDHADGDRRHHLLRTGLRGLRPDLIALQETTLRDGFDQAAELLGDGYHFADHPGRSADGVGATLASRWPIEVIAEVDLHVTDRVTLPWAVAVIARVALPEPYGPTLVAHHKPSFQHDQERERELQAVAVARAVERLVTEHDQPVILLGDFDDTPDSASIRFWTGRQSLDGISVAYRDAWAAVHPDEPGHTFTPVNPLTTAGEMAVELGRRIDYILVRGGGYGPRLMITDCRLIFDRPVDGTWPSDHFGLVAELAPAPHRPGEWADAGRP